MNNFSIKLVKNIFTINNKGFTIVETLVAITILMIAIAGPLVAASRSLNAALYSRDQMIASFLAQETMEVLKNFRSNTVETSGQGYWLDSFTPQCIGSSNICDIGFQDDFKHNCTTSGSNACIVGLNSSNTYVRGGSGNPKFARHFYFEDKGDPSDPSREIQAHVIVQWNQGKIPYELELVSEMLDSNI